MGKTQRGFTLVEIAIVLVIIGLLLGGALKGQELINNAKVKHMVNDFRNIPVFVYGYQDKFRALPGDDPAARAHLGAAATQVTPVAGGGSAGNGRVDGPWNSSSAGDESFVLWQHVRLAGFAAGTTALGDAGYRPTNADGGLLGIESVAQPGSGGAYIQNLSGTYLLCSSGILGKFARQIDITLDDGNGAAGQVRIVAANGYVRNGSAGIDNVTTPSGIDDAGQYTTCMAF
ncbi:MAG TPA: prepilin-type N-terminal cleavage/methylation domain-containing protein [Azospira sp.]|nr:prepilin-type N-terminal cleavage/methylation domain-containing protein [Azospira sp.]